VSKILVALDLGESHSERKRTASLLRHSEALARSLGSGLELVHVENSGLSSTMSSDFLLYKVMIRDQLEGRRRKLRRIAAGLGVLAKPLLVEGHPVDRLVEMTARPNRHTMAVMGTHGRTGLSRLVLGSVAEEVIRRSRIPVATLGPKCLPPRKTTRSGPVFLIGAYLGPNSQRAESLAFTLARKSSGSVVLYHCLYEGLHPVIQSAVSTSRGQKKLEGMLGEIRTRAARTLKQRVEQLRKSGVDASYELDERGVLASDGLLQTASKTAANYILLGTHGRNLVSGAFFGSTVRRTILGAHCPVITVRSRG
jgi:nucleotide-binding universal stress UspA family protein